MKYQLERLIGELESHEQGHLTIYLSDGLSFKVGHDEGLLADGDLLTWSWGCVRIDSILAACMDGGE